MRYIILFILVLSCVCAGHEIDYNDPSQVAKLPPKDLSAAIASGKNPDLSQVDDSHLADAIRESTGIVSKLSDKDLSRAVGKNPQLIKDDNVFYEIDSRSIKDLSILNKNPDIKKHWFEHMGITDEECTLLSYDGNTVTTGGDFGTTFSPRDFPGATVKKTGELVLADSSVISYGTITLGTDKYITINGGAVDITSSTDAQIHITDSTITSGDRIFHCTENSCDVIVKEGVSTYYGQSMVEMRGDQYITQFSGAVRDYGGHREILAGTDYEQFTEHGVNRFKVSKNTYLFNEFNHCYGTQSCIEFSEGILRVIAKEDNLLQIFTSSTDLAYTRVEEITDSSQVVIDVDKKVKMYFLQDNFVTMGDQTAIPGEVEHFSRDSDGKLHMEFLKSGHDIMCSICSTMGCRYSKISNDKIATSYSTNPNSLTEFLRDLGLPYHTAYLEELYRQAFSEKYISDAAHEKKLYNAILTGAIPLLKPVAGQEGVIQLLTEAEIRKKTGPLGPGKEVKEDSGPDYIALGKKYHDKSGNYLARHKKAAEEVLAGIYASIGDNLVSLNGLSGIRCRSGVDCRVHKDVYDIVRLASENIAKQGYTITLTDAHRDPIDQLDFYIDYRTGKRKSQAANPFNKPAHCYGYAIDGYVADKKGNFFSYPMYKKALLDAAKTLGKSNVRGLKGESWHIFLGDVDAIYKSVHEKS